MMPCKGRDGKGEVADARAVEQGESRTWGRMASMLPLAGEHRAATATPVGCRRGEPG
jgi:hypothetical protein